MSFIDLYSNVIWSETDISNKVQALIRSQYSAEDELKASRLARQPKPNKSDLDFIAAVDQAIKNAIDQGRQSRNDNQLLINAIDYEQAYNRLIKTPEPEFLIVDDEQVLNTMYEKDLDERKQAQEIVDQVSNDVLELVSLRNNLIEPVDDVENAN